MGDTKDRIEELDQEAVDNARVQIDIARAREDGARAVQTAVSAEKGLPADVVAKIEHEVAAAAAVVKELEADARAKGIPLTLSGNRYRIYIT